MCAPLLSHVQLFGTPWTVAHQTPLFMVFPTQEYWSGLLSLGDFLDPGIESASPALAGGFFTTELPWKPILFIVSYMLGIPLEDSFLFGCAPWPMGILVPQTGIEPAP